AIPGDLSQKFKERGFVAGGFFGAQKQYGSWVFGLEADMNATGMKMSFQGNSSSLENITRIVPTTKLPDQTITVPAQTIPIPGQDAPVDVTTSPEGLVYKVSIFTGLAPGTVIPAGSTVTLTLTSGGNLAASTVTLKTINSVTVDTNGNAVF